jgi:hypothetical protein
MLLVRSLLIFALAGLAGSMLGDFLVFRAFDHAGVLITLPFTVAGACLVGCGYGALVQSGQSRASAYSAAIVLGTLAGALMLLWTASPLKSAPLGAAFGLITSVCWTILDLAITSIWPVAAQTWRTP